MDKQEVEITALSDDELNAVTGGEFNVYLWNAFVSGIYQGISEAGGGNVHIPGAPGTCHC
jgi:bacteriocin-like protein